MKDMKKLALLALDARYALQKSCIRNSAIGHPMGFAGAEMARATERIRIKRELVALEKVYQEERMKLLGEE